MAEDENHKTQGFVQRVLTCCVSSAILIAIFSVATFLLVQISDFIIPDPDEPDRPTKSVAATKTPTPPEVTPTMSPPTVAPATFTPPTNWPPTSRPTPAVIATVAPPTVAPPSVDELLQQASASADRGDGAATVALFEKIKTISPARLEGATNLIETLSHRHQHKAAITGLSMMTRSSTSANLWMVLAQRAFRDRDRDSAEAACLKVVTLKPNRHSAHYLLAMIYQRKGKLTEALVHAQKALQLAPTNSSYKRLLERLNKGR